MTDLAKPMQRFVANAAITPSAVRQGRNAVKGVQRAAIEFMCDLDIADMARPDGFPERLDFHTERLTQVFPDRARYWGRARKCLNIFLRQASFNFVLRATFKLDQLDEFLETPVDSLVAEGLRRDDAGTHPLPRWESVIALTPDDNAKYQDAAADVARTIYGTHRANLDLWYLNPV